CDKSLADEETPASSGGQPIIPANLHGTDSVPVLAVATPHRGRTTRYADPAAPAVFHRPAGLGNAYRAYRDHARVWIALAAADRSEHAAFTAGLRRRHRRHRAGAEQQRHRLAGHFLRRPGPDDAADGTGRHARGGRRYRAHGAGADAGPFLAVAAVHADRRLPLPHTQTVPRRPVRPATDRAGPDHSCVAADRPSRRADFRGARHGGAVFLL